jgi:hypothetical protein
VKPYQRFQRDTRRAKQELVHAIHPKRDLDT